MKTIAIYHKDCSDGTAAAAVVLKKYPDALLFPLGHSFEAHELIPILDQAKKDDRIITADCVIGVREFLAKGFEVTSLDHHIGIKEEMEKLAQKNKNFTFIFDNTKSGASLAWSYFFPEEKVPDLIKYVEDADLWRWKYEETKYTYNSTSLYFNQPEKILPLFDGSLDELLATGKAIRRYTDNVIKEATEKTEPIYLLLDGMRVPFYNITVLKSESGNVLSLLRRETVGLFTIDGQKVKISLRSVEGQKPTALDIASKIGGGGHIHASGAAMNLDDFIKAMVK